MPRDALNKRLFWLWNTNAGVTGGISERSFAQLSHNVRQVFGFDGLKVKIYDGTNWQGRYGMGGQPGRDFPRLDNPGALNHWINEFNRLGLEFHATAVAWGSAETWEYEANAAIVALQAGAQSFTWDVEPPTFGYRTAAEARAALRSGDHRRSLYWRDASWSYAAPMVHKVRQPFPDACLAIAPPAQAHAIDPHGPGSANRVPLEPFLDAGIDGICPQIYWTDFQRPAADILAETVPQPGFIPRARYPVQGFPPDVLQGASLWPYPPGDASPADIGLFGAWLRQHDLTGYTVFRLGGPGPGQAPAWKAARPAAPAPPPDDTAPPDDTRPPAAQTLEQRVAVLEQSVQELRDQIAQAR